MSKARKSKKRRSRKKKEAARAAVAVASADEPRESAAQKAAEYVRHWVENEASGGRGGWKFNKTRQSFLLRWWKDRARCSADTFKHVLLYMKTLPEGAMQRTVEQARSVAREAEEAEKYLAQTAQPDESAVLEGGEEERGEDGDGDGLDGASVAERRAVLQIQRARALRVLKVLVELEGPASGGGAS